MITNTFGGRMSRYERVIEQTVQRALDDLDAAAKDKGYDGCLGVRISHPTIVHGGVEVVAYGTGFHYVGGKPLRLKAFKPLLLPLDHGLLAGGSPTVASQPAVLSQHAMTGGHVSQRIATDGSAHGPNGQRRADSPGDIGIARRRPQGNREQRPPHRQFELRPVQHDIHPLAAAAGNSGENTRSAYGVVTWGASRHTALGHRLRIPVKRAIFSA